MKEDRRKGRYWVGEWREGSVGSMERGKEGER